MGVTALIPRELPDVVQHMKILTICGQNYALREGQRDCIAYVAVCCRLDLF